MRIALTVMGRVLGRARRAFTNTIVMFCFLVAVAGLFAFNLFSAEGSCLPPGIIWCSSVAPILPFLVISIGMNVWSDEIQTGRINELLSVSVHELDYVIGKFLGVWLLTLWDLLLSMILVVVSLLFFNSHLLEGYPLASFATGFIALLVQSMLWSAVIVLLSATTRSAALSAIVALGICVFLPRGGWLAALAWMPYGSSRFGIMPLDSHVFDMAMGRISAGMFLFYLLGTCAAIYICTNLVQLRRCVGVNNRLARCTLHSLSILSFVVFVLSVALVSRFNLVLELPIQVLASERFSPRTQNVLAESQGEIRAIVFSSRRSPNFKLVSHFVRALSQESLHIGGAHILPRYVDPYWDSAASRRLINLGIPEETLVFELGNKREIVPLDRGFSEHACISALQKMRLHTKHRTVYWTTGHGEIDLSDYGKWGFSDIARTMARDGYENQLLDLSQNKPLPADCSLIIVAGAQADFTRSEQDRLSAYLRQGGRLLVLLSSPRGGVADSFLEWGVDARERAVTNGNSTITGSDVVVSSFSDHPIVAPLQKERLIFDALITLSSATNQVDVTKPSLYSYAELCMSGEVCCAALLEHTSSQNEGVVLRPARIVVVGDVGFIQNNSLENAVTCNKDFFLNCISYLAGVDTLSETSVEASRLFVGMDRKEKARYVVVSAIIVPTIFGLLSLIFASYRRRR